MTDRVAELRAKYESGVVIRIGDGRSAVTGEMLDNKILEMAGDINEILDLVEEGRDKANEIGELLDFEGDISSIISEGLSCLDISTTSNMDVSNDLYVKIIGRVKAEMDKLTTVR